VLGEAAKLNQSNIPHLLVPWGLYSVFRTLNFLNKDCSMAHGHLSRASIFVTEAGEWKLGGLELCSAAADADAALIKCYRLWNRMYLPPETVKVSVPSPHSFLVEYPPATLDAWGAGCLIYEVFNGVLHKQEDLARLQAIPPSLSNQFKKMLHNNPQRRLHVGQALEDPYFDTEIVRIGLFLSELALKDVDEKVQFFSHLQNLSGLPPQFSKHKLIPELLKIMEFGGVATVVVPTLIQLSNCLSRDEFDRLIMPALTRCFSSSDRSMRLGLLNSLESYVDHLDSATIEKQILPSVLLGFGDTVAAVREVTVKSMVLFVPKLKPQTIVDSVLKHFAASQSDAEPTIRCNATIAVAKCASYLPESVRDKVIVSSMQKALKDPYPRARCAGVIVWHVAYLW
jgi:SCY1-like protein 1